MTYYRVVPDADQHPRYKWKNGRAVDDGTILIAHELYTPAEFRKLANCPAWFEQVNIAPKNTYFFFGARFKKEKEQ